MTSNEPKSIVVPYKLDLVELYIQQHITAEYSSELETKQLQDGVEITTTCDIMLEKLKGIFKEK
ncbi:hypothetical protein GYB22_04830 [bacterium]|nr:hypothetical protein [bacterium]